MLVVLTHGVMSLFSRGFVRNKIQCRSTINNRKNMNNEDKRNFTTTRM